MQNNLIDTKIVDQKLELCGIRDMEDATIRDIVKVVNMIEAESGEKFIRMEMGVPGLPPSSIGIQAEIDALRQGVAQFYPMLEGHKEFKEEGSKFVKNFMDIEIKPEGIVPTVGSMQACYAVIHGGDRMPKRQRYRIIYRSGISCSENADASNR